MHSAERVPSLNDKWPIAGVVSLQNGPTLRRCWTCCTRRTSGYRSLPDDPTLCAAIGFDRVSQVVQLSSENEELRTRSQLDYQRNRLKLKQLQPHGSPHELDMYAFAVAFPAA